jgi:hypothetical protein
MEYKVIPFEPPVSRQDSTAGIASALETTIRTHGVDGWEFVELSNHSTVVPGSEGCFGLGGTPPYPKTMSVAVFRR